MSSKNSPMQAEPDSNSHLKPETPGMRSEEDSAGECQPPLSRDPPPPDSPLLTLKMEVNDEDYQESDEQSSSELSLNSICKYKGQCKFDHATVFEKELFFRTELFYLPPHAIAHMQPAEAPGPSTPPTEGGLAEAAAVYHSHPLPGGPVVHPGVSGVAGGGAEARPSADALAATAAIPAFPREWRDMDDLGAAAAREAARPAEPKKFRVCDINMYRYQRVKNLMKKAQRSSQELEKIKAALAVKLAKQRLILNAIQAAESSGLPVAGPSTRREVELASIAAARNQQEAEQSMEVITSLQDQLDKLKNMKKMLQQKVEETEQRKRETEQLNQMDKWGAALAAVREQNAERILERGELPEDEVTGLLHIYCRGLAHAHPDMMAITRPVNELSQNLSFMMESLYKVSVALQRHECG